jgi:hypothetical protein
MWQKAKMRFVQGWPWLSGMEIWVEMGRPVKRWASDPRWQQLEVQEYLSYRTNFMWDEGNNMCAVHEYIELLARGPEDFSETVEFVPMSAWRSAAAWDSWQQKMGNS